MTTPSAADLGTTLPASSGSTNPKRAAVLAPTVPVQAARGGEIAAAKLAQQSVLPVTLLGIGTAVPAHKIMQTDAAAVSHAMFADRYPEYERMHAVFTSSGIVSRYAVKPIEWYQEPRNWADRTAAYLEGATALFAAAAARALDDAGLKPTDIDAIVTVSSTGIATPSLEARYLDALGLGRQTRRVPVFGLGCGGGVAGLSIAADLARAAPGRTVLLVAVEVCTLSFRLDTLTKSNIVATALFGDGAGACIIRADGRATIGQSANGGVLGLGAVPRSSGSARHRGLAISVTGEHTWPATLDLMGWNVDPDGFGVVFARAIPPFARTNMGPAMSGILARGGLEIGDIGRFVCHPGGARVVDALEQSIGLDAGSLDHERSILAEYGDMSAPTVLFVLERVLAEATPSRAAMIAMGPGFTASCAVLEALA